MTTILNYIRDTLLVIAAKALVLMFCFNAVVANRFELLKIGYGEAFLIIFSLNILLYSNYKSYVVSKLESIEALIGRNNDLAESGNGVRYALGVTNISNILSIKNKLLGHENDSTDSTDSRENIQDDK